MWGLVCGPHNTEACGPKQTNESWWASQVVCAKVEEVRQEEVPEPGEGEPNERFYKFVDEKRMERWMRSTRLTLAGPPNLGGQLGGTITAFTEVRQPYWLLQPRAWITYHAFVLMEVDGGSFFMLCERKTDMLELVIGEVNIPMNFMKAFRALGPGRNPSLCVQEPRQLVHSRVSVHQLLAWIDGPVEERWRPYDLLKANCQHFAADLSSFLLNPGLPEHRQQSALQVLPRESLHDRHFAISAVSRNPRSLKHMPEAMRRDREVVLAAVNSDGNAVRYAPEELRADREVALAAVRQHGYALPYIHPAIRQDRDVVLAAVQQNGYVLCYCAEEHRMDREVVLAAVRQEAYALRYVAGKLRCDPEVLLAAGWQNPVALARATLIF